MRVSDGRTCHSGKLGACFPLTIIPRRQALAVKFSALDADLFDYQRDELEAKIKVGLGGRAAEELVFDAQMLTLFRDNRARLDTLAAALLEHETLDEADAYAAAGLAPPGAATGTYAAAARSAAA
jgi:ATP-dependent Zn protease